MKPNYKNWVPKSMLAEFFAAAAVFCVLFVVFGIYGVGVSGTLQTVLAVVFCVLTLIALVAGIWLVCMHRAFSYDGKRQLSREVVEGIASYVTIADGGKGLDVGCGSGALTIAVAKRNPKATMLGVDRWGKEYASYSKKLCEDNAKAENVTNVSFQQDDAFHLNFPDEVFDCVTSNYVYHNIPGVNKQLLLRETLRVLKKGGTFALHDIMSQLRYGDMETFVQELKNEGYEDVRLIDTTDGTFMTRREAMLMDLGGSKLLVGKK